MNSFYLQYEMWKLKRWADGKYILHRSYIAVDHSSKFKDIQSMVNPRLIGYDTENVPALFTNFIKMEGKST